MSQGRDGRKKKVHHPADYPVGNQSLIPLGNSVAILPQVLCLYPPTPPVRDEGLLQWEP